MNNSCKNFKNRLRKINVKTKKCINLYISF